MLLEKVLPTYYITYNSKLNPFLVVAVVSIP